MYNDITFFTNEPNSTLLDRFNKILKNNTRYFDVIVGYFRTSGFYSIYEALDDVEKIRILVGINTDIKTIQLIEQAEVINILSTKGLKDNVKNEIIDEYRDSSDSEDIEIGARKFVEFICKGKLEMRIYPHAPIHAKVYIIRKSSNSEDYGKVITGSSNFSYSGLVDNLEFNVELKDSRDVRYAHEKFEELWVESVNITQEIEDVMTTSVWASTDLTPYEVYLKFLYEYFKEEINRDKSIFRRRYLPDGFMRLLYQEEAVIDAKKRLEAYNGVFISDVVGLGKTFICAMLAQQLEGRKLVIAPPTLVEYWRETFEEFNVPGTFESLGKLDKILGRDIVKYDYIFIDESHRFRNQDTERYEKLHQICYGKKVILVSATPLNNYPKDIESQLYLFQNRINSNLTVKNLEAYFRNLNTRLKQYEKGTPQYISEVKAVSRSIREEILQEVMIRRTRKDILLGYKDDIEKQGLTFPELDTPKRLIYELDDKMDALFKDTLHMITTLNYARYKTLTYLINPDSFQKTQIIGQKNMVGFMKSILIKRLESSFYAFKETLKRFISSHERFIKMCEDGTIWISNKTNIDDYIDSGEDELLEGLFEEGKAKKYNIYEFQPKMYDELLDDYSKIKKIYARWESVKSDPKLETLLDQFKTDEILKTGKVIIFTEAADTSRYLLNNLKNFYGNLVLQYSAESSSAVKNKIKDNFSPRKKSNKNDLRILITTDVLAEGINLQRANIVINYDLPWNPTRVMQRVGRINRVGSEYDKLYVYNFFPTSQGESAINLEANIVGKIQAFHQALGEDVKYLTEDEEVNSYSLYETLNSKEALLGEDEDHSNVYYISLLRKIRDGNPTLFNKIKNMPQKAKVARCLNTLPKRSTITLFKNGYLKKIYLCDKEGIKDILFSKAVELFKADPLEKAAKFDNKYFYEQLNKNKQNFISDIADKKNDLQQVTGKSAELANYLDALIKYSGFTDYDIDYVKQVNDALFEGRIPKGIINDVMKKVKNKGPVEILNIIETKIPDVYFKENNLANEGDKHKPEIILSEYFEGE